MLLNWGEYVYSEKPASADTIWGSFRKSMCVDERKITVYNTVQRLALKHGLVEYKDMLGKSPASARERTRFSSFTPPFGGFCPKMAASTFNATVVSYVTNGVGRTTVAQLQNRCKGLTRVSALLIIFHAKPQCVSQYLN